MYMHADKVGYSALPSSLSFAVRGNLTMRLQSSIVQCDLLRLGYWWADGWLIGSESCEKVANDPHGKSSNPSYSLLCPCQQGVVVKFQQNSRNQLMTSISDCTEIRSKKARWVKVGSSPRNQTMVSRYGVQRSYDVK